ncbi:hypothetical protein [Chitinophaga rhizophila]|uniref:Uncharacterized protein n=1 Tax=Chitinophaga rhizophila TaxID=2866212 RepID=A0ABS7GKT3_9BACT|nr:hypothetical protein [Chitinophaga rhizophila]MBW8688330.1 hypothetical protein [Chitinophaga rhizophila]
MYHDIKTNKISKLVITGAALSVERLFIAYLDIAEIKFDKIRAKGTFYYELLTDKITLNGKSALSVLTIAANPEVTVAEE